MKGMVIVGLLLLSGCASQTKVDTREGDLIAMNNNQGLSVYYQKQLQSDPNNTVLMAKIVKNYLKLDDIESALFYTKHLIDLGYDDSGFLYLAGNVYMASEQYLLAIDTFQAAQDKGYNKAELNISLGVLYSSLQEFDKALEQFNRARLKGFDDVAIKNNIAVIYIAKQEYKKAIAMLTPIYERVPDNERLRMNLAVALIRVKDYKNAREILSSDYSDAEFSQLVTTIKVL